MTSIIGIGYDMRKLGALENPFYRRNSAAVAIDERGGAPA